jgi:hypothetical protein
VTFDRLPLDDVWDIVGMGVATGRLPDPRAWVDEWRSEMEEAAWEAAGPK